MPLWPSVSVAAAENSAETHRKRTVLKSSLQLFWLLSRKKNSGLLAERKISERHNIPRGLAECFFFFPNRSAHNSVIVFAARLFREMGANPSLLRPIPVCPDSSVGWRNDVVPILGFRRRRLKPWRLTGWRVPASGFSFSVMQTCSDTAKPINLII